MQFLFFSLLLGSFAHAAPGNLAPSHSIPLPEEGGQNLVWAESVYLPTKGDLAVARFSHNKTFVISGIIGGANMKAVVAPFTMSGAVGNGRAFSQTSNAFVFYENYDSVHCADLFSSGKAIDCTKLMPFAASFHGFTPHTNLPLGFAQDDFGMFLGKVRIPDQYWNGKYFPYFTTFTDDGRFFAMVGADSDTGYNNWRLQVFSTLAPKKPLFAVDATNAGFYAVGFSSDGKRVLFSSDSELASIYKTADGTKLCSLESISGFTMEPGILVEKDFAVAKLKSGTDELIARWRLSDCRLDSSFHGNFPDVEFSQTNFSDIAWLDNSRLLGVMKVRSDNNVLSHYVVLDFAQGATRVYEQVDGDAITSGGISRSERALFAISPGEAGGKAMLYRVPYEAIR